MRGGLGALLERWLAIGFAVLSLVLLYSAIDGERGLRHVFRLNAELSEANQRNFRLVQGIHLRRRQVQRIRSDDAYLEQIARRRLSLVRQDEILYRVLAPTNAAARDAGDSTVERGR